MELINTKITKPRYRYEGRGGIYLGVVDFDKEYYKNSNHSLVVNDLDITTAAGKETFRNLVYTRHDGDIFSDVPTCPCGTMRGGHLIGMICQTCNNPCTPLTERSLEPIIWMRSLHDKVKFMNIQIYTQLRHVWNKGGFSVLDYLIDPKYVPKDLNLQGQLACEALNLPRGLKAFEENFDEIIEILLTARLRLPRNGVETMFSFTQRKDVDDLRKYISKFRDLVFCSYLPFPTAIGFVIEEVGGRKYGNHVMTDALDALYTIANAANSRRNRIADAESRMARTVSKLANYHSRYESDELFDKYGLYRMLTYGYRPHFSFRTVITSIHDEHSYDEVQLPWSVAVMMMKLHIANKLLRRGKSPNEIFSLISENILRTHPTLTEIFDELIEESPNSKGIPLIFTRYPSLLHGSTQLFWCKHIKKDPADVSTALSVLVLSAYNADFDGDYMSGQILLDNRFVEFFKRMEPHTGLMSLDKPFRVSNHAKQPEPVLHTLNHRIRLCDQRAIER